MNRATHAVWLFVWLAHAVLRGAEGAGVPVFTNALQIHRLAPEQAELGYPVRLAGVVTYSDPVWQVLFIQDAMEGIFVLPTPPRFPTNGEVIEIVGKTGRGGVQPVVAQATWQPRGSGTPRAARLVHPMEVFAQRFDCEWSEVVGIVHAVRQVEGDEHLEVDLVDLGVLIRGYVFSPGAKYPGRPDGLIDARVSLTGVGGIDNDPVKGRADPKLFVPGFGGLRVVEPPPVDPFRLPAKLLPELRWIWRTNPPPHRVHVQGVVTYVDPEGEMTVQEGTAAVRVSARPGERHTVGEGVEVVGFLGRRAFSPILEQVLIRPAPARVPAVAVPVEPARMLWGEHDGQLVRVTGTFNRSLITSTNQAFTLLQNGVLFGVSLGATNSGVAWPRFEEGDRVQVTGVCAIQGDQRGAPQSFQLLLRAPGDAVYVSRLRVFSARQVLEMGLVVAGAWGVVLFWGMALRRRVGGQTALIRERLERERAMETRYHHLLENAAFPVIIFGRGTLAILYMNQRAAVRLYGSPAAAVQAGIAGCLESAGALEAMLRELDGTGCLTEFEARFKTAGGQPFWTLICANRIEFAGQPAVFLSFSDISERKRMEEALAESENRFRTFTEAAFEGSIISERGLILDASPRMTQMLGYELGEMVGKPVLDFVAPVDRDLVRGNIEAGVQAPYENRLQCRDGSIITVETRAGQFVFHGRPVRATAIHDITARKRAEEALRENEERYVSIFENSLDAILLTDPEGAILAANPAACHLFGYSEEELGRLRAGQLWAGDGLPPAAPSGPPGAERPARESTFVRRDGGTFPGEIASRLFKDRDGVPRTCSVIRDLRERKSLEERLRQAHKMEGIGHLAGGVAHEFNNILAAMVLNLDFMESKPLAPPARDALVELRGLSKRAADLVVQLLAFGRKSLMRPAPLDLTAVVGGFTGMLHRLLGEDVLLDFGAEESLPPVLADPGMVKQVVMNLCLNARDAMGGRGSLRVRLAAIQVEPPAAGVHPDARPGRFVCLAISDTGQGMTQATRQRLFEPFFTTKEVGKGVGLGLSTVYGIVRQHRGWIGVESEVGRGSTFRVYLPVCDPGAGPKPAPPAAPPVPCGHETILLVEDEPAVRIVTRRFLERAGYHVLEAENGEEAVEVWQGHRGEIALLLTDMAMPGGMTGLALAQRLRQDEPRLRVVVSSGYHTRPVDKLGGPDGLGITYLQKPVVPEVLTSTLRKCLDGG